MQVYRWFRWQFDKITVQFKCFFFTFYPLKFSSQKKFRMDGSLFVVIDGPRRKNVFLGSSQKRRMNTCAWTGKICMLVEGYTITLAASWRTSCKTLLNKPGRKDLQQFKQCTSILQARTAGIQMVVYKKRASSNMRGRFSRKSYQRISPAVSPLFSYHTM